MTDDKLYLATTFHFAVGDMVYFKAADHDEHHRPKKFVVLEQIAQRCIGGLQRMYKIDGMERLISEVSLTDEMPKYEWADKNRDLEKLDLRRRIAIQDLTEQVEHETKMYEQRAKVRAELDALKERANAEIEGRPTKLEESK